MTNGTFPSLPEHKYNVQKDVKYRYALGENQQVIDIGSDQVIKGNDYSCISCGKTLRPVKGVIRQKHFRHKTQVECSPETYLHNLAKRMFFQIYSECLKNNQPYFLEYQVPRRCKACKDYGPCDVGNDGLRKTDLAKNFREIFLETRDGEFIPDILLKSETGSLYVEIAVTHFVAERKENSGAKILEIAINNESDIELITSCNISENDSRIGIKNFIRTTIDANFTSDCQNNFYCFILYPNGKSVLVLKTAWELENLISKGRYVEIIGQVGPGDDPSDIFVNKVTELHLKSMHIKNCWLCTFHSLHYQSGENFCKLKKTIVRGKTNQAVECNKYNPKKTIPECGLIQEAINMVKNSRKNWSQQQQIRRRQSMVNLINMEPLIDDFFAKMLGQEPIHPAQSHNNEVAIVRQYSGKQAACEFCGKVFEYESEGWAVFHAERGTCKCKPCLAKTG